MIITRVLKARALSYLYSCWNGVEWSGMGWSVGVWGECWGLGVVELIENDV